MEEEVSEYFVMIELSLEDFGLWKGASCDEQFVVDGKVCLGLFVLPLGFPWAFHLSQHSHIHLLTHDVGLPVESIMVEGFSSSQADQVAIRCASVLRQPRSWCRFSRRS